MGGVVLAAVVLGFGLVACGPNSWETAVARANQEQKPLVVEFYADWCEPCVVFEAEVLSDRHVKGELAKIHFKRYDFDSAAGQHHARRLGVVSVPSLVYVKPNGEPGGGIRGAATEQEFVQFLAWTHEQRGLLSNP